MASRWGSARWGAGYLWGDETEAPNGGIDPETIITPTVRPYRPRWAVYVRDGDTLERVAQLDEWASCEFVVRHNGIGAWQITLPGDHPAAPYLLRPRAGVIIERDGQVVLSGPRGTRTRSRTAGRDVDVTVGGFSDDVWLNRRVTLDPADGDADPRSGVASTLILAYIDNHAGPSARADRRVAGLTIAADPILGESMDRAGRRRNLYELCVEIARAAGVPLGFRIRQSASSLVAEVYAPADRRAQVLFSIDAGTLAEWEYGDETPEANWLWLGGEATGATRVFATVSSSGSIVEHGRIEQWADHTDVDNVTDLRSAGRADLIEKAAQTRIEASPISSDALRWQRDWTVGDFVSVVVDGTKIVEQVREVAVKVLPSGIEDVTVRVGADGVRLARQELALMRRAARIERRVRALETV
jgi:hypothetical protein